MRVDRKDSYSVLIKAGMSNLRMHEGIQRDVLALFSSLENFQRELYECTDVNGVLDLVNAYVKGLGIFEASGVYLVNFEDFSFNLALCDPEETKRPVEDMVAAEMKNGRFASVLNQLKPVIFECGYMMEKRHVVFHSMVTRTKNTSII